MAKRFIDTNLFEDEWFCELSKDSKLFWMYFITSCDHAGLLKINKKLCEFKTGIKSTSTVLQELGNRIVTVKEDLIFCPKFLQFQYPGFPNCKFNSALSAIRLLEKNNISYLDEIMKSTGTVDVLLTNSTGNSNGIGKGKKENKVSFSESSIFDKTNFKGEFPEWGRDKLAHYWNAADAYSTEGNKYVDWKKAIQQWSSRDEKAGKLKFSVSSKYFNPIQGTI